MKPQDLTTKEVNTWCPGCPNFGILQASHQALAELANENEISIKKTVLVAGIGCSSKIYDYVNLNAFYGIHGRVLPACLGIKLGNPELTVVGHAGDGDTYAEGISHFIHNCRYNADFTMVVHNNQVFSLTTGQATPTTEQGFVDGSTPMGVKDAPLNPLALAIEAGATFVARGYALNVPHLKELIKKAVKHKGFSFIDILQPCIIFHKHSVPYLNKNVYEIQGHDEGSRELALGKAREWDYSYDEDKKVPIGVFYETQRPVFDDQWPQLKKPWHKVKRDINWQNAVKEFK